MNGITTTEIQDDYLISCVNGTKRKAGCVVFDIETMPLDFEAIKAISKPFEPPPHPGEFDPSSVKCGNLKDQAKIDEKIEAAKEAHRVLLRTHDEKCRQACTEYNAKLLENAPLSPLTGRVLAIGLGWAEDNSQEFMFLREANDNEEADLLTDFWESVFHPVACGGHKIIGHNIAEFDIPFMLRRSWILGVEVPGSLFAGKWLSSVFVDTRQVWEAGQRGGNVPSNLDVISRAFGLAGKTEGMNGGDFHKLWWGSAEDRLKASEYLANDVELTMRIAKRMGVV